MAIAPNIALVTLLGHYVDYEGQPVAGQMKFTLPQTLLNSLADQIIVPSTISVPLDTDGDFSVTLPATNDPDLNPADFTYRVEESFQGGKSYDISLAGVVIEDRVNLAKNPSVETSTSNWESGLPSRVVSSDMAFVGTSSLKTSATGLFTDSNVGYYIYAPTASLDGKTITYSWYVSVPAGSPYAGRTVSLADESAGTKTDVGGTNATLVAGAWARISRTYTYGSGVGVASRNLVARVSVPSAELLLKQATFWLDAAHSSASGQTVSNLGTGGSALNATCGSTGSADSNDPKFLGWNGQNYVYLPGVTGNYLSVPDAAALDITGDIDLRAQVALDSWTPSSESIVISKWEASGTYAFYVSVLTSGVLRLVWSANGTSNAGVKNSTVATGLTAGAAKWVRVTLTVNNGASGNDVKFYLSDDGVTWTQLGTTVTTAGTTSIYAGTARVAIGSLDTGVAPIAAKVYRAQVYSGINGTPVLDVDTSLVPSGNATSFTALTGQTVTVNRSTSGRKTTCVVHPVWLFGTDDYMQIADSDLLDFGATDSFTVVVVARRHSISPAYANYISKRVAIGSGGAGWSFQHNNSAATTLNAIYDGTNYQQVSNQAITLAEMNTTGFVVDRTAQTLRTHLNGTLANTVSTSSVGSLATSVPLWIGRDGYSNNVYSDMELIAVAIFRRALSASEITTLSNYYQNRVGTLAGSFYHDAALIEESATLGTYFDGSTTMGQPGTTAWTGTPNASTSIYPDYGGILDIADIRPTDSGYPAFVSYASQSAYDALEARVVALEETVDTETGNFSFPPECQFLLLMGTCDAVLAAYATCDELASGRILVPASAFVQFQDDVQGYALAAEASQLSAESSLATVLDVVDNYLSPFLV